MTSTNSDMAKYPMKKLSSDIKQAQKGTKYLTGSADDFRDLIKAIKNWQRYLENVVPLFITSDELCSGQDEANHTNRLRNSFEFMFQETENKRDSEKQRKRNPVIRSELKKLEFHEVVFLGITFSVSHIKILTHDEIKYICEFIRQLIETNHLEPYLRQERFVTAIKNAHVINLVEQHFSDFEKFKKDVEARSNELASKKRKKVSDNNDPAGESLRASSVSADVAEDDNTCCFRHFLASLGSAEDEETSSSSHLPQIQAPVLQPASGQSREHSSATTDTARERATTKSCNESDENYHATAQPLRKRARIGAGTEDEVPTAGNTGECLQEQPTPNVGHLTVSPSRTQECRGVPKENEFANDNSPPYDSAGSGAEEPPSKRRKTSAEHSVDANDEFPVALSTKDQGHESSSWKASMRQIDSHGALPLIEDLYRTCKHERGWVTTSDERSTVTCYPPRTMIETLDGLSKNVSQEPNSETWTQEPRFADEAQKILQVLQSNRDSICDRATLWIPDETPNQDNDLVLVFGLKDKWPELHKVTISCSRL
ncbi:hypothetical protein FOQG_19149 [Fusarium oxysporum f. sp. raphani 54005]|uniref:Uncharacterized protein n=1 Tax=Fusarium oxysporum f. sp. raphani 54005 TaxID=1089458 RepID=X0B2V9_FUSOX|nr:hypothetical protein FOQG_19149 [Fusarium oxysporum f. sp. raphani 54005]